MMKASPSFRSSSANGRNVVSADREPCRAPLEEYVAGDARPLEVTAEVRKNRGMARIVSKRRESQRIDSTIDGEVEGDPYVHAIAADAMRAVRAKRDTVAAIAEL